MAGNMPYGQQPGRNPFSGQGPSPYSQPSHQYSVDSVGSDMYNSRNASAVPLNDPQAYYGHSGQYTPQCKSAVASLPSSIVAQKRTTVLCADAFPAPTFCGRTVRKASAPL